MCAPVFIKDFVQSINLLAGHQHYGRSFCFCFHNRRSSFTFNTICIGYFESFVDNAHGIVPPASRYLRSASCGDDTVADALLSTGVWRDMIQLTVLTPCVVCLVSVYIFFWFCILHMLSVPRLPPFMFWCLVPQDETTALHMTITYGACRFAPLLSYAVRVPAFTALCKSEAYASTYPALPAIWAALLGDALRAGISSA